MKTLTNILLVAFILFSCRGKEKQADSYSFREDSLIYQLADSLILPDSIWRKFLLVPPPLFPEDYSKSELKKQRDSLLQRWDTARLYMAFDDTLIIFSKSYHSERLKDTKGYFKYNINNVDTLFFALFDRLVSDTTLSKRKIDIREIHTNYKYKIISKDSIKTIRDKGYHVIEIHQFSRIIFNDKFDKACLYEQSICGGECGGGSLIFLERKNGVWKIIERKSLWVS